MADEAPPQAADDRPEALDPEALDPDAVAAALDAAVEALDDELVALYLAAAHEEPIAEASARLIAVAERVSAAAAHFEAALEESRRPPPEPERSPAELLAEAADTLDAAVRALDGLDAAIQARAAERVARAAEALHRAARTVELWSLDLDALAPPPAFATPARAPLPPAPPLADRIATTALDPDRAFVAWSVTAAGFARAQEALLADEPPTLTLRVYLEGDGFRPTVTDHPVDEWVGQTTMTIADRGGALLVCAIGLAAGGTFAHVARAAAVQLPTAGPGPGVVRFSRVVDGPEGLRIEAAPAPAGPSAPIGFAPAPTPFTALLRRAEEAR